MVTNKHISKKKKRIKNYAIEYLNLLHEIPSTWKLANIYLTPKPKPWGCSLNNTRPVTLLETARKVMVKILNKQLLNILVQNNVLQGRIIVFMNYEGFSEAAFFYSLNLLIFYIQVEIRYALKSLTIRHVVL
ncbi:unnamed protein product [Rhizophagus irregularis]|nr:unnamed protein product [Rhizophagus irregularis]